MVRPGGVPGVLLDDDFEPWTRLPSSWSATEEDQEQAQDRASDQHRRARALLISEQDFRSFCVDFLWERCSFRLVVVGVRLALSDERCESLIAIYTFGTGYR